MAIEKKRALFMELLGSRESNQADINTANLPLRYVELSEEAAARVREQNQGQRFLLLLLGGFLFQVLRIHLYP